MRKIGLIGAGRGCYEIIDLARSCDLMVVELYDDVRYGVDEKELIPISNKINPELKYAISIGDPVSKKKIQHKHNLLKENTVNVISPQSHIGSRTKINEGLIMQRWSRISNDAEVGWHIYMNFSSGIAHDSKVGDFSFIGPSATILGGSKLGEGVFIGGNAIVSPDVEVGEWSVIGACSIVTKNVPPFEVWVGNPAKFLRKNEDGIREKNKGNI